MTVTIHDPQWHTYEVHGHTLAEVMRHIEQMDEAAQTRWHPTYHATSWTGNTIATAQVDVTVTVSMPHWSGATSAPAAEQAEWQRFLDALHRHEQGHIDLVRTYLEQADTLVEGVDEHTASTQWHDNLTTLQTMSDQYDADNDHGRNDGTTITLPDADAAH